MYMPFYLPNLTSIYPNYFPALLICFVVPFIGPNLAEETLSG